MSDRIKLQEEAIDSWKSNNCQGTLLLGTGFGKSRVSINCIIYYIERTHLLYPQVSKADVRVLWLTNSERLRDIDTKDEFIKWGAQDIWNTNITAECIQSAYKWRNTSWDLVVCDEFDFYLTESYSQFFSNNKYNNILGLTATIDRNKEELLDKLAPVIFRFSTSQAQDEGILNKSTISFVKFMLDDKNKYIATKGKGKSVFYQTENEYYTYLEKRCISELLKYNHAKILLEGAILVNNQVDILKFEKQLKTCAATHKFWTTKRANFLWELKSSRVVAKRLLSAIWYENKTNKCLIFSKRVEQVEQIVKTTYHSKNKKDNTALEDLSSGEARVVGVVQAVNRGVNINGLTHLIFESYDGSSTSFQQRHGRGTRLGVDDVMNAYILVPYYNKDGKIIPTQAYKWAKDMTSDFTNIKEIEV